MGLIVHFAIGNVCLEPEHMALFGRRAFSGECKDLWMTSAYIKVDPNSIDKPL